MATVTQFIYRSELARIKDLNLEMLKRRALHFERGLRCDAPLPPASSWPKAWNVRLTKRQVSASVLQMRPTPVARDTSKCIGYNSEGKPCGVNKKPGSDYCGWHG